MSYLQLTIGGKLRGLKFNQMALLTMSQYLDYDNIPATYGYALVYAGLRANCYVKREEADFSFEQCCEWVEQMTLEDINKVREVFEATQTFKTLSGAVAEEQTKKKPRSTTKKRIK